MWSGNEDDCREVTWEECNPVEKIVPMSVAKMICVDMPVGEIFRGLISYTSHISFPHFMVLTDSIMMFHPDFQGYLLRLCKRNKPSHGRYYGLYCRKGLKTNSKFDQYMACGLISLLELCIISIHPNLPTEWPFFHTFLSVCIISTHPIWSNFLISPGARLRASDKSEVRRNKLHALWGGGVVLSSIYFKDILLKKRGCCNEPPSPPRITVTCQTCRTYVGEGGWKTNIKLIK